MKFRYFYEQAIKVIEYEELLRKENQKRKSTMETYFQDFTAIKITVADVANIGFYVYPLLEKKASKI